MEKVFGLLKETFEKQLIDNHSKKELKELIASENWGDEENNLLIKTAFDWVKTNEGLKENHFIIEWLQAVVNIVNSLKSVKPVVTEICFSPTDNCVGEIIEFVNSAKKSLYICVFTISDDRISRQILERHKLGVDVRIISDNDKLFDKGSDIQDLAKVGLKIKVDNSRHHMHHKYAIVDDGKLLTGSYNWTRSASKYNQENFLILNEEYALKRYLDEFHRLWKTSFDIEELLIE